MKIGSNSQQQPQSSSNNVNATSCIATQTQSLVQPSSELQSIQQLKHGNVEPKVRHDSTDSTQREKRSAKPNRKD